MNLSEMKQIISEHGLRLTKSLGQNFLHDGNQLRKIAAAANLTQNDRVLEIGPGLGPLTELLVHEAGEVLAIEKDQRLATLLEKRLAGAGNLTVITDDALDRLQRNPTPWSGWKLVANLPYSVASPILVELAQARRNPDRMVVTLQLEVARRLTAQPGDESYGVLTLLIQLFYESRDSFKIPAGCFFPVPDVDSACVTLIRRPGCDFHSELTSAYTRIVKRSFSQRRKMMFKLLKEDWPENLLVPAFRTAGLMMDVRAESVSREQFVELASALYRPLPPAQPEISE